MCFAAIILCGPGAVVLSVVLLRNLAHLTWGWTQRKTLAAGVLSGIWLAFMNVPGYFVVEILRGDTDVSARIALLFIVAGASCGLWIGWLAWKAWHPGERFFPRFSLRTLVLLVLLWGGAMLAFQPRKWPLAPSNEDYRQ